MKIKQKQRSINKEKENNKWLNLKNEKKNGTTEPQTKSM